MLRKLQAPYRHAPARISVARIDQLIAQGAQASVQSSGRRGVNAVDLVTFTVDGQIVDQFPVSGHAAATARFVTEFNQAVRNSR